MNTDEPGPALGRNQNTVLNHESHELHQFGLPVFHSCDLRDPLFLSSSDAGSYETCLQLAGHVFQFLRVSSEDFNQQPGTNS
jgi:hypothetical protein